MMNKKDDIQVTPVFGKDASDACSKLHNNIEMLNNPLPTGDHWKVIDWVKNYERDNSFIAKLPVMRADFIKRAARALNSRGAFCMMVSNQFARKFRDDNGLRGERGRVFIIIEKLQSAQDKEFPAKEMPNTRC